MSQKETTDAMGRREVREWPIDNLAKCAELARQAFEQKRTKDCLDFTRAMLLIDPDNAEAQSMRSSIQSEMHRDLDSARAFLRQAQETQAKETNENAGQPPESDPADAAAVSIEFHSKDLDTPKQTGLLYSAPPQPIADHSRRSRGIRLLIGAAAIVAGTAIVVGLPKLRTHGTATASPRTIGAASDKPAAISTEGATAPDLLVPTPATGLGNATTAAPKPTPVPVSLSNTAARVPAPAPALSASLVADASTGSDRTVAAANTTLGAAANGTLAISSPTSVDIFENDALLGSAPVSLDLAAGTHTLEYRHGNMRRTVTYTIRSNETAKATINFEVNVQINSRPWAEVFVDGVDRKDLGQTPLGSVQVPIGSVLAFENPQFKTKKYRVTGNETGIQIVFP